MTSPCDYLAIMTESSGEPAEAPTLDEETVRKALRTVKDPEVGMNIVDLGLVYTIEVDASGVKVQMTLTSPGCPVGPQLLEESEQAVRDVDGVEDVTVELVWEPYWTPERIDPKVRSFLGF